MMEQDYIIEQDQDGKQSIYFNYFPKTNHTSIWIHNTKTQKVIANFSVDGKIDKVIA